MYNKQPLYWKARGFTNYNMPFFYTEDDFFHIEENNAREVAKSLKYYIQSMFLYEYDKKDIKIIFHVFDKKIKQKKFLLTKNKR